MISSSSDTTAEEPQNDCGNSSNEWGACRLRQRKSTNRVNSVPFKVNSFRLTRSSETAIQSPPPPSTPTSSTTLAVVDNDSINASIASQESIDSENEEISRTAVRSSHTAKDNNILKPYIVFRPNVNLNQ